MISVCSAVFVGVLLLGINAAVGDAPGYDPPGTGVSPVFNNLTVTGTADVGFVDAGGVIAEVIIGENIASGDGGLASGGSLLVDGNATFGGWVSVADDLNVTGDIQASGNIGSFYKVYASANGVYYTTASCSSGDYLTGCSGYHTKGLMYTYPSGVNCTANGMDSGNAGAYAFCFDPQGVN